MPFPPDLRCRPARLACLALLACAVPGAPLPAPAATPPAGSVAEFQVPSRTYARDRRVWVYTPPDYDARGASPCDLLVRLRDALRARGYDVAYAEIPGGRHEPGTWGPRLPLALAALARR